MKKYQLPFVVVFSVVCILSLFLIIKQTFAGTDSQSSSQSSTSIVESSSQKEVEKSTSQDLRQVSIFAVGDNLLHSPIIHYADSLDGQMDKQFNFVPIYELVKPYVDKVDLAYYNQETILGGDDREFTNYPIFNSPSQVAIDFQQIGFNLVNIANNHTLDQGPSGVEHAVSVYQKLPDTLATGAFISQESRDTIPIIERNNVKIAFLAYTEPTNGWIPDTDYRLNTFDKEIMTRDITLAKEQADIVIVSAHWGDENIFIPNEIQKEFAQLFADLKVDLVIGSHPHVIQPIEWVEGSSGNKTLVIYSLGNFISHMIETYNLLDYGFSANFVETSSGEWTIEDAKAIPFVTHYQIEGSGDLGNQYSYKVYPLADYPDDLAARHRIHDHGEAFSKDLMYEKFKEVVPEEFQ